MEFTGLLSCSIQTQIGLFCTTFGLCSTPGFGKQDVDLLWTKICNFISFTFLSTRSNLDHQLSFTQTNDKSQAISLSSLITLLFFFYH